MHRMRDQVFSSCSTARTWGDGSWTGLSLRYGTSKREPRIDLDAHLEGRRDRRGEGYGWADIQQVQIGEELRDTTQDHNDRNHQVDDPAARQRRLLAF